MENHPFTRKTTFLLLMFTLILASIVTVPRQISAAEVDVEERKSLMNLAITYLYYQGASEENVAVISEIASLNGDKPRILLSFIYKLNASIDMYKNKEDLPSIFEEDGATDESNSSNVSAFPAERFYSLLLLAGEVAFEDDKLLEKVEISEHETVFVKTIASQIAPIAISADVFDHLSQEEVIRIKALLETIEKHNLSLFSCEGVDETFFDDLEEAQKTMTSNSTRSSCGWWQTQCTYFYIPDPNNFSNIYRRPGPTYAPYGTVIGTTNGQYVSNGMSNEPNGCESGSQCDIVVNFYRTSLVGQPSGQPYPGLYLDHRTPAGSCIVSNTSSGTQLAGRFWHDNNGAHVHRLLVGGGLADSCGLYTSGLANALKLVRLVP